MKTLFLVSAFYSVSLLAAPSLTSDEQNQIRDTFPEVLQRNSEIRSTPLSDYVAWSNNPQITIPSMIRKDFRVMDFAPIPPGGNPGKVFDKNDLAKERADQFARMNKEPLIAVKYGDGRKKLLIISAPECPTCKKLESELSQNENILNATIYYVPVRLNGSADPVLSNFWCASGDKGSVWQNWWKTGVLPAQVTPNCQYSYKDSYALWRFFGQKEDGRLTGTPTIVQEDGTTYAGYPPDKQDFIRMFGGVTLSATDTTVAVSQPIARDTNSPGIGQAGAESRAGAATQSQISNGTRTAAAPQTNASQQVRGNSPGNLPQKVQEALDYLKVRSMGMWSTVRLVDNFLVFEYLDRVPQQIRPPYFPYEPTGHAIALNATGPDLSGYFLICKKSAKCTTHQSDKGGITYGDSLNLLQLMQGDKGTLNAVGYIRDYVVKQYGAWEPKVVGDAWGGQSKTTNSNLPFDRFNFSVKSSIKRCERENKC